MTSRRVSCKLEGTSFQKDAILVDVCADIQNDDLQLVLEFKEATSTMKRCGQMFKDKLGCSEILSLIPQQKQ